MTLSGIGIDAVDVARFRTVLARRPGLVTRLFTEGERAYAERSADRDLRLATRFAAKEAVMKSLGVGIGAFPLVEVEVVRDGLAGPRLALHGAAAARAEAAGVTAWHLSLTHTEHTAMAMVAAVVTSTSPTL